MLIRVHLRQKRGRGSIWGSGDYYAQLSQRTEVLSFPGGEGATVLLSPDLRPAVQYSAGAYLELNEPNAPPRAIELYQPHFIIGRS